MQTRWLIAYSTKTVGGGTVLRNAVTERPPAEWLLERLAKDGNVVLIGSWPLPKKTVAEQLQQLF